MQQVNFYLFSWIFLWQIWIKDNVFFSLSSSSCLPAFVDTMEKCQESGKKWERRWSEKNAEQKDEEEKLEKKKTEIDCSNIWQHIIPWEQKSIVENVRNAVDNLFHFSFSSFPLIRVCIAQFISSEFVEIVWPNWLKFYVNKTIFKCFLWFLLLAFLLIEPNISKRITFSDSKRMK